MTISGLALLTPSPNTFIVLWAYVDEAMIRNKNDRYLKDFMESNK
jgi:hypothetical protein